MAFGLPTYADSLRRESLMDVINDIAPDSEVVETVVDRETGTLVIAKDGKWYSWDGAVWDQTEPIVPSLKRLLESLL